MKALGLVTFALFAGCGVTPPAPVGRSPEAIVGGTPSTDADVFILQLRADNGRATMCSATLIAPRTLLTAAHCVDPSMLGTASLTITASNAASEAEVIPGVNTVRVLETRLHPAWNPAAGLGGDLALLLLETAQPVPPRRWNAQPLAGLGGEPVRAVGYGASSPDAGMGTKRTVDLTIRQLTPELITLGNLVDKGICHGDSGGPTLHTFGDGVERLVGVHSFTRSDDCLDGADTRVDAKALFLLQWLSEKEDACGLDQVCAVGACPTPDPDCVPLGSPCQNDFQCQGRACTGDAQHDGTYCSRPCSTDGDCGALGCDAARRVCQLAQLPEARPGEPCVPQATFCLGGTVCSGPSPEGARCSRPCAQPTDCPAPQACVTGFSGRNACVDPPPLELPLARLEGRAANCTVGVGPGWIGLALLLLRRP